MTEVRDLSFYKVILLFTEFSDVWNAQFLCVLNTLQTLWSQDFDRPCLTARPCYLSWVPGTSVWPWHGRAASLSRAATSLSLRPWALLLLPRWLGWGLKINCQGFVPLWLFLVARLFLDFFDLQNCTFCDSFAQSVSTQLNRDSKQNSPKWELAYLKSAITQPSRLIKFEWACEYSIQHHQREKERECFHSAWNYDDSKLLFLSK